MSDGVKQRERRLRVEKHQQWVQAEQHQQVQEGADAFGIKGSPWMPGMDIKHGQSPVLAIKGIPRGSTLGVSTASSPVSKGITPKGSLSLGIRDDFQCP